MTFYRLRFSLASGINQTDLLAKVKSAGGDGVQASDGLYVAVPLDRAELEALVGGEGVTIDENPSDLTPDMEAFRKSKG